MVGIAGDLLVILAGIANFLAVIANVNSTSQNLSGSS